MAKFKQYCVSEMSMLNKIGVQLFNWFTRQSDNPRCLKRYVLPVDSGNHANSQNIANTPLN